MSANDCCICYETIQYSATTPCNHVFCTECYTQSILRNNQCPMCRSELYHDEIETVSSPSDYDEQSEYEETYTYMSEYTNTMNEDDDGLTVEAVMHQFAGNGYGLKDAISLLISKFSSVDPKYTEEYNLTLCEEFNNIIWELRVEHRNRLGMAVEDRQALDVAIREYPIDPIPEPTQLPQHVSTSVMYDITNA